MLHRHHRAREGQRKVSPSGPTPMSSDQIANYLKDLRTNRPARPSGSRPLPSKGATSASNANDDLPPRASSAMSSYRDEGMESEEQDIEEPPPRATSALSNHNTPPSRFSFGSSAGRPLAQGPRTLPIRKNVTPSQVHRPRDVSPNAAAYRESAQRRMEKEEARSLRDALEEMDHQDETRIHLAAQDEATELVWAHQNPDVPYKNPYAPYRNPDISGSRRDSQKAGRSQRQSLGNQKGLVSGQGNNHRSASDSSADSHHGPDAGDESIYKKQGKLLLGEDPDEKKNGTLKKNLKVNFALPSEEASSMSPEDIEPTPRNVSNDSSKGVFRNPNDHIYEEPEDPHSRVEDDRPVFSRSDPSALRMKPRNSLLQGSRPLPNRSSNSDFASKLSRFEIHKNPPSQSKNPRYRMNESLSDAGSGSQKEEEPAPTKDGVEIRGDDIRAATSKRLKDRSEKLPTPSAVSDRAGRPIVSFNPSWNPGEAQPKRNHDSLTRREPAFPKPPPQPEAPAIQVSEAPSIPVINLPDDKEPTISEMETSSKNRDNKGGPPSGSMRNMPRGDTSPKKPGPAGRDHWYSPYSRAGVPTAKCESCSLPIAGQVVTAANSRLHPECFMCHHCKTPLECVAFYQEPEAKRNERLADAAGDDEEAWFPRFYCHLDFHELFSPRCKSCKTPIEGEVVVACGAEWHVGHFFCAECGDPFDPRTPFVEKDGFAWCLQCHSKRSAPRCLRCRQPVMEDVVITAIGGQWHDQCFVCHECGTGLGSDGRYFVKEGEPKRTAKGRIIGGPVQLAVCERCEDIRLRA